MEKRKFNLPEILEGAGLKPGKKKYLLLTHRGFGKRGVIPENTMEAFNASYKRGFTGHELDVRITKDGTVVIFHGPGLETTTEGRGLVENKTYAEIMQYNCGNYLEIKNKNKFIIPTLDEYLKRYGKKIFTNIEIKREWNNVKPGLEKSVIDLVKKYNCEKNVLISSFNLLSIFYIRKNFPWIRAGALIDRDRLAALWIPLCIKLLKPDSIHIHSKMNRNMKKCIAYIKKNDCGVVLWGVNEKADLSMFLEYGADIMITDNMSLI